MSRAVPVPAGLSEQDDGSPGVDAFARLLEVRSEHAARHSDRVARLALAVAGRLGLGADREPVLRAAARLHDVGMIGVPDRILLKDRPLDQDEWAVLRCHPVWGAEALAGMPGLEETATVVRFHHERWDGRGYPDGLAGEAIPLESRIIGACDAYCSMTAERPYRGALSPFKARTLVRGAAGQHFDPAVAEALLAAVAAAAESGEEAAPAPAAPRPAPRAAATLPPALPDAIASVRLPALEESRQRLLRALEEPHPAVARVVDLVETDPGLTAAVLGAAGDAGADVPGAIEALGMPELARVTARTATFDVFEHLRASALAPERFRLHAVATRRAVRRLGRVLDEPDVDGLVAAALLHDVGKLVLARLHAGYPPDIVRDASTPEERLRAERRELGLDHAVAGAALLRRWGLPRQLTELVAHHHDEGHGRGAELVRLADMLAHYATGEGVDPTALLAVARRLGMSAESLRGAMFDLNESAAAEGPRRSQPSPLSDREREALRGLAEGKVYKEIATDLGVSTSTVRSHLSSAYAKLEVADRAQAVLLAAERGWL